MSGLQYAFIPDRVDLSALMRCQTHSLGSPRALRPPAPSPSLSLSQPSTLSTLLFPSATYFLSPCLLFSSCPHQLLPPSYLSTLDCSSNFGSRRGCLYASVFISCCLCWNRMCVSACFTEQINHNRYGSAFLISAKSQAERLFCYSSSCP